jgi:hypothetical protein
MYEHSARHPAGHEQLMDDSGAIQEFDTHQCCHCSAHFRIVPGSGTRRGFCMRCGALTCGNPGCDACAPIEARLDFMEGKITPYTDVILASLGF